VSYWHLAKIDVYYAEGSIKNQSQARHWWLTPVILATWEAVFERIANWANPGK
jgi:hypothetical protein